MIKFQSGVVGFFILTSLFVIEAAENSGGFASLKSPNAFGNCTDHLVKSGHLFSTASLSEQLEHMRIYLAELHAHAERLNRPVLVVSTPMAARQLEGAFGPIITTTTFSRELTMSEHFDVATHLLGFLSGLPKGGVILASGGTMGPRDEPASSGGGVGILQTAAMQMDFKTLSITASSGFKYRAAPADFLLFSLGGFGSESRTMYELSKVLLVVGGGGQAYVEAVEYLQYNPDGVLIVIDDPKVKGSSEKIATDPRFRLLAESSPRNIVIARTGSEAAAVVVDRLQLGPKRLVESLLASQGINIISPFADHRILAKDSATIGFSGWSNFSRAGADLQGRKTEIIQTIDDALIRIHRAISAFEKPIILATAGNDPGKEDAPAFETLIHRIPRNPKTKLLALTAEEMDLRELNAGVHGLMYVAPTYNLRTHQFVSRLDSLVTAGGNQAVVDQLIQAANFGMPHLHILGANTLTDMRAQVLKNPNLKILKPEEILALDDDAILKILNLKK